MEHVLLGLVVGFLLMLVVIRIRNSKREVRDRLAHEEMMRFQEQAQKVVMARWESLTPEQHNCAMMGTADYRSQIYGLYHADQETRGSPDVWAAKGTAGK